MKIAIIGGSGKMGQWFARFLLKEGKQVIITGRNQEKLLEAKRQLGVEVATNIEATKKADIILISVPIDNFEAVVKEISPYIHSSQIIIDITSIKTLPVEIMHKYIKAGLVLGMHPVFGPGAKDITDHNFVLTPTTDNEIVLANKIKEYLEARGARVTKMTPQEHDEMMAVVLGLAHFIAIVSADTLLGFDKLKQMKVISGTTYKLLLTLVESVLSEDPQLYASLQMSLPNLAEIEKSFQATAKIWADLVANKDQRQFADRMNALKNKFEKDNTDFGKAYENMYRLVEGL